MSIFATFFPNPEPQTFITRANFSEVCSTPHADARGLLSLEQVVGFRLERWLGLHWNAWLYWLEYALQATEDRSLSEAEPAKFCEAEGEHGAYDARALKIPLTVLDIPSFQEIEACRQRFGASE